ncbi:hypothetical protein [Helicobacter sp. 23-1045]
MRSISKIKEILRYALRATRENDNIIDCHENSLRSFSRNDGVVGNSQNLKQRNYFAESRTKTSLAEGVRGWVRFCEFAKKTSE